MNSTKHIAIEEFKRCAAKGCANTALHFMKIVYLQKGGWFCQDCKYRLLADGLLLPNSDPTPESKRVKTT